jgi:hypothetical protein
MVTKITQAVSNAVAAVIVFGARIWDSIPVGVQFVIRDVFVSAVAAVAALNLALPTTTSQATAETMLVVTTVVYTAYGVIRREIWPLLINWVIDHLGVFEIQNNKGRWTLSR